MSDAREQFRFSDLRPMPVSILNMFRPSYDIILEIKLQIIFRLPLDSFFFAGDDSFLVRDRFALVLDGHLVCLLGSYFYCPASFTYPLCCYFLLGFLLMFPPGFFPTTNSAVCFLFFGFV